MYLPDNTLLQGEKYRIVRHISSDGFGNTYEGVHTMIVALKRANELGLYDMSGNVWEWCSGFMGKYNSNAQTDPEGIKGHHLHAFRGGCWDDDAMDCRPSNRECVAKLRGGRLGLRLVLAP